MHPKSLLFSTLTLGASLSRGALFPFLIGLVALLLTPLVLGMHYTPEDRVGLVEKRWSTRGALPKGQVVATRGEAGYQAQVLGAGLHFRLWPWQYKVHRAPRVVVPTGSLGYVIALENLQPQTDRANSQSEPATWQAWNASTSSTPYSTLREGTHAINLAQFIVLTRDRIYRFGDLDPKLDAKLKGWQQELEADDEFVDRQAESWKVSAPAPVVELEQARWVGAV